MGDIIMGVSELTRITGIPDWTADANIEIGSAAAGDDWYFPNDGQIFLLIYADGGVGETLTFTGKVDKYGRASADLDFAVASGETGLVGPFSPHLWNDTDGLVKFVLTTENVSTLLLAVRITDSGRNGV